MQNTIRAQLGRKSQPTRMEEENGVVFDVIINKDNVRTFSLSSNSKTNYKKPIGTLVKEKLNKLINKDLISPEEIISLQRADYSKQTFHIQFPFLQKIKSNYNSKIPRYWKKPITIKGEMFLVCSEWYEQPNNNDRPYFLSWYKNLRMK